MRRRAQQVTLLALVAGGAAAATPEEVHALQQHHQPHVDSAASSSRKARTMRYGGEVTHNMALWSTLPHHPLSSGYTAVAAAGEGEALRSITTLATKPSVPENFFWGNISGVSYLTPIRNQHIPTCASAGLDSATTSGLPPPRLVPSPLPSRCRCMLTQTSPDRHPLPLLRRLRQLLGVCFHIFPRRPLECRQPQERLSHPQPRALHPERAQLRA